MIYIVIFLLLILLSLVDVFGKMTNNRKIRVVTIICSGWMVISSIRWERGTDWSAYYNYFMGNPLESWYDFEIGYKYFNYVIKTLSNSNYSIFLFFMALLVFYFQRKSIISLSIIKENNINSSNMASMQYRMYPFVLMLSLWALNLGNIYPVRSTLAFLMLFYSIKYIQLKDIKKFIGLVLLASLFHRTAIIYLPAYFIYHSNISKRIVLYSVVLVPTIFKFFTPLLILVSNFLGNNYESRARLYLSEVVFETSKLNLINITMLMLGFYLIYQLKCRNDSKYRGYLNLFYVGFLINLGASVTSGVFYRLAEPYTNIQLLLFPYIFSVSKDRGIRVLLFIILIAYLSIHLYLNLTTGYWDLYVPYKSIFNKGLDVKIY